jgi:DNA-binding MarR family transcriptional regulator
MNNIKQLQKLDRALHHFKKNPIFKKNTNELSESDLNVLFCVYFCESYQKIKLTDISKALHLTLPAVTIKVKGLVEKGFVTKESSKKDQRIIYLKLTEKSSNLLKELVKDYYQPASEIREKLGDTDTIKFIELLEKLIS